MQDNLIRLVRICFFGLIVLLGTMAAASSVGTVSVPVFLGAIFFLLVLLMQFSPMLRRGSAGGGVECLKASFAGNTGGVITLIVIVAATIIVAVKAI